MGLTMISRGSYSDYGVLCVLERARRITRPQADLAWEHWSKIRDAAAERQQEHWAKEVEREFPGRDAENTFEKMSAEDRARWPKVCEAIRKASEKMMPDPGAVMAEFLKAKNVPYDEHNVGY
jgi:hypothetical protein